MFLSRASALIVDLKEINNAENRFLENIDFNTDDKFKLYTEYPNK